MKINGQNIPSSIDEAIDALKSLGSGFPNRTEFTGKYYSRGESEPLRARLETKINDDVRNGKSNPMSLNFRLIAADAHRVEGGEVGFSANEPIGTDNTHDCVTVMLRDPVTKKTALAHIGGDTTEESLELIWRGMPYFGIPLEMRLLGGRQLPITVPETDDSYLYAKKNNDIARWNVEKVVRFFHEKPVNVLSADILSPDQPAVVVVDPKTFGIEEKVPGKSNPNATAANALGVLYTGNYLEEGPEGHNPLRHAFDLTRSPERDPILLTGEQMSRLQVLVGETPQQIKARFEAQGRTGFWLDQAVERTATLCNAYKEGSLINADAIENTPAPVSGDQFTAGTGQFTSNPRHQPGGMGGRSR